MDSKYVIIFDTLQLTRSCDTAHAPFTQGKCRPVLLDIYKQSRNCSSKQLGRKCQQTTYMKPHTAEKNDHVTDDVT